MVAYVGLLLLSIVCDVLATAYMKVAGERLEGRGFFLAALIGIVVFAPSIVAFGYAIKAGPSYLATIALWAVGIFAGNTIVGICAFGDRLNPQTTLGIAAACLAVLLLRSAR